VEGAKQLAIDTYAYLAEYVTRLLLKSGSKHNDRNDTAGHDITSVVWHCIAWAFRYGAGTIVISVLADRQAAIELPT